MAKEAGKNNLRNAKKVKKDEFYPQLSDIEMELKYFKKRIDSAI